MWRVYLGVGDEAVLLGPGSDKRPVDVLPVMVELLLRQVRFALEKGYAADCVLWHLCGNLAAHIGDAR